MLHKINKGRKRITKTEIRQGKLRHDPKLLRSWKLGQRIRNVRYISFPTY